MDNGTAQLQLPQLEQLCDVLYNSQVPDQRKQAESYLQVLGQSVDHIPTCKTILDSSQSPYAQLLASSSLLKVVTEQSIDATLRLEMRNYFLQYLESRSSSLEPYVVTSLIQLLCRTTKLGWFENEQQRQLVDSGKQLLERGGQGSVQHYLLGLKILSALVSEMNQQPKRTGKILQVHRKTAVAFKDQELFKIFQIAMACLKQLKDTKTDAETERKLKEQTLQLSLVCLSFDFVGTCLDECSDEPGTIQIPQAWRTAIEDPSTVHVFHDYYCSTSPPLSNMAMECLVRVASVRRSIFQAEPERLKFLGRLLTSTTDILRSQRGLGEMPNYNEFCKLLGRLKTNFNLQDLVSSEKYSEWVELVAHFTTESLKQWRWAGGSVCYLLALWTRLVTSVPYLKGEAPALLDTKVPDIVSTYIHSRLQSVEECVQNNIQEDLLDDEGQLQEQLENIPQLCRFKFEETAAMLFAVMDPLLAAFQQHSQQQGTPQAQQRISILEGQLTWVVYIVSSIVRGRPTSSNEVQDALDGELSSRVFRLLTILDENYPTGRCEAESRQKLDIAILNFFQNFRKIYVGEQVMMSSKVYNRLADNMGLKTHNTVLEIMVQKIASNLQVYGSCEDVINATLNLFQELAGGYMSGKLLLGLDTVSRLLANHNNDLTFLREPSNFRNRTIFYCTLGKLLFLEDTPTKFKTFVAPLQQVLMGLVAASNNGTDIMALRNNVPQETVICLFRDLQGIVEATNSKRTYGLVFNWLHPAHFPIITKCIECWADLPQVTTPILKFMSELVFNKTQRVTFENQSPNGILLFRQVSEVLTTFGQRVLVQSTVVDEYKHKYKGIWICLLILMRALAGNYVIFGVFELYGDQALNNALDISLKMAMSIPLSDILAYRKISKAYYALLDVLCLHHVPVIAKCDRDTFRYIMTSLEMGLKALEVSVSAQCATAIDNVGAYYFRNVVSAVDVGGPLPAAQALAEHIRYWPEMFPSMLQTLFETILFEECPSMWSFSRPMLSLILINDEHFQKLKTDFIRSQPADRQAAVASCLDKLMVGVQYNLEAKNRDKFTQNLTVVRHEFKGRSMV